MLSLSYLVFLKMIIGKQSNVFLGELGATSLNKEFGKRILLQGNWFHFSKACKNMFIHWGTQFHFLKEGICEKVSSPRKLVPFFQGIHEYIHSLWNLATLVLVKHMGNKMIDEKTCEERDHRF
jgi:hypothetical protein